MERQSPKIAGCVQAWTHPAQCWKCVVDRLVDGRDSGGSVWHRQASGPHISLLVGMGVTLGAVCGTGRRVDWPHS